MVFNGFTHLNLGQTCDGRCPGMDLLVNRSCLMIEDREAGFDFSRLEVRPYETQLSVVLNMESFERNVILIGEETLELFDCPIDDRTMLFQVR